MHLNVNVLFLVIDLEIFFHSCFEARVLVYESGKIWNEEVKIHLKLFIDTFTMKQKSPLK